MAHTRMLAYPCGVPHAAISAMVTPLLGWLPFLARPHAGELVRACRRGPVDSGPDRGEDRALQGGSQQDFPPAAFGIGSAGRIVLLRGDLPDPLEDHSGDTLPRRLTSMLTGL